MQEMRKLRFSALPRPAHDRDEDDLFIEHLQKKTIVLYLYVMSKI
jgi:hypothetical protein